MQNGPKHDHPYRVSLTQEMHLRTLSRFSAPMRAVQWLVLHPDRQTRRASVDHVNALTGTLQQPSVENLKHVTFAIGALRFIWEEHAEFSTYSLIAEGAFDHPFAPIDYDPMLKDWIEAIPGEVYRATRIALMDRTSPQPDEAFLDALFNSDDIVCCDVHGGAARVWSDFRVAEDGFGRLLVRDEALVGGETSRVIQQLQELGNYRKMTLLGLPTAQELVRALTVVERDLAQLARRIAEQASGDEEMLHDLSAVSARLALLSADTQYRLAATNAYANIVSDRLDSLEVRRVPGCVSLREFNERRLLPAVRTCLSASEKLKLLSEQASWTSALMRTRIDTATNRQSRDLLASMNRRTQLQLRLQQTVEGLSVVAISYYLVGLVHYVAEALGEARLGISVEVMTGASVPLVLLFTTLMVHRIRHAISDRGAAP